MVRGVNKRIIEVSNPNNSYFEKVILFVNPKISSDESVITANTQNYLNDLQEKIQITQKKNIKLKTTLSYLVAVLFGIAIMIVKELL